jgi:hypothetical protein
VQCLNYFSQLLLHGARTMPPPTTPCSCPGIVLVVKYASVWSLYAPAKLPSAVRKINHIIIFCGKENKLISICLLYASHFIYFPIISVLFEALNGCFVLFAYIFIVQILNDTWLKYLTYISPYQIFHHILKISMNRCNYINCDMILNFSTIFCTISQHIFVRYLNIFLYDISTYFVRYLVNIYTLLGKTQCKYS